MRPIRFLSIFFLLNISILYGQTGTQFWFACPDISFTHDNDSRPIWLHVTALFNTTVTISRPADPTFIPYSFTLAQNQTQAIDLATLINITQVEVFARAAADAGFIQNKGFLITADPGEITAYVEYTGPHTYNTDIVALKSTNALGTNFWVSTQRKYKNHAYSDDFSGCVIVATVDNTVVTVTPGASNNLEFHGSAPFIVTLQKGQTFALRAHGQAPNDHIFGVHVTTNNKPIAITIFDDSMEMTNAGGSWDLFADQLIPVNLIGREYIILKGNVQDAATTVDGEGIFITPTQNGTNIWIDNVLQTATPLNAGDYFQWNVPSVALSGTVYHYVRADKPVYVNHVTGYGNLASGTRELGGAVLPTIDGCTGSNTVTVKRTPAASSFRYFHNLMVRNDTLDGSPTKNKAIHNFWYSVNGGTAVQIPANHFRYTPDSAFAIYDRILAGGAAYYNNISDGQTARIFNDVARFHLGVMQGDQSTGCRYGYFSDYANSAYAAGIGGYTMPNSELYCNLDPIRLVANGGTSYKWYAPIDPLLINKLDYDTVAAPYFSPDTTGAFYFNVIVKGECWATDTLELEVLVMESAAANFTFSTDIGCSPFAPLLTNYSDTVIGVSQVWTIKPATGSAYQINQDTIPRSFLLTLPENHTDTLQIHKVSLVVKAIANGCPTQKSKDITVKPQVDADFSLSDTIGCHPLLVQTINNSTGHLDSSSYNWDFGDNSQSFEYEPSKNFYNFTLNDTTFNIELIVESPFGCTDTLDHDVIVHPRVSAKIATDTSSMCTPLSVNINPSNSYGADTLWWHVDYYYSDSIYKTTSKTPINIIHSDTSLLAGPDTLWVQLVVGNRMGCLDTSDSKRLIAYPEVIADFTISDDDICDSIPITLTNQSIGYDIFYEWDFGNNTFRQDSVLQSHTKLYFNRTDADTVYTIVLNALSGYFCESVKDTTITVHPYIKADFGLNYETNCSPADAIIYNTSIRSHTNHWIIGYDDFISPDPVINHTFVNFSNSVDTTYNIKLIANNNEGCFDSISRSIYLYPRVVAAFDLTKLSNCPPLDVEFNNNSTGGYTLTYTWEFGDNTSSSDSTKVFTKQYNNETPTDVFYPIQLTARNQQGCDSTWYDTIAVFANIRADFSLDDYENCPPFSIQTSEDCSQGTNVFNWTFGDGNTSALENPSNTYFNNSLINDTLQVQLIAMGANDAAHQLCADTATRQVVVFPNLVADFEFTGDSVGCQPLMTGITNNSNLLAGSTFRWFINNEFYQNTPTPLPITLTNLLSTDVTKTVYLYGRSVNGCLDTVSHTLTAYSLVDAFFAVNRDSLCSSDSVNIDRSNSQGGITQYLWSFEGETPANFTTADFYHSYENYTGVPVDYDILLIAQNSHNCLDSMQRRVTITPQVNAGFSFDNNSVCYPHLTQISNSTQYANSYYWDFGDNISSTTVNPSHQYLNFDKVTDKSFDVKLIARSKYNCYDSITMPITIKAKPAADFYFPIQANCPPFDAQMINNSIGSSLCYSWDFAGEGTSTLPAPTHTFSNNGNDISVRPITLIVTSDKNCSDTLSKSVNVYPNVQVDFGMSDNAGCSPLNVQFDGDTSQSVIQMYWYIDGVAFSTIKDPSYRFANETPNNKIHNIRFIASSLYECSDTMDRQITVYPTPVAEFIPDPLPADYGTTDDQTPITFYNETTYQNNWDYIWNYGDGNSNTESAETFTYNYGALFWGKQIDNYFIPVQLISFNSSNPECRDTVNRSIIIYPPLPKVDIAEDLAACVPYEVDFSAWTKYVYDDSLLWDLGDGNYSTEYDPVHTYTTPGVYAVKLIVKGEGGTNWDYKIITVNPKPEVDFTFNDSIVFDSSQTNGYDWINFYNMTKFANKYYWYKSWPVSDLYDTTSNQKEPSWYYDNIGTYYVALIAESDNGCLDTMVHPTPIRVMGEGYIKFPTAFFVDPDLPGDEYDTQSLTNKRTFYPDRRGIDEYRLEIYNRWGVLVFVSEDVNKGWNGYIQGAPAKQDVYVWRVKGRFTNGQPFDMSGDVTLIRGKDEVTPKL